jgi:predicted DNA-binding protein with PD1-like motif
MADALVLSPSMRRLWHATGGKSMRSKLLHDDDGQRTFAVVLESGEEAVASLQAFAVRERISAAQFSAIGAFSGAVLIYFDWERKKYLPIPVREQVEVASLTGDVALSAEGNPALHIHAVVGRRDGSALAGHLSEAQVRPTLEVVLTESPTHLRKRQDPESGLALIRLDL